MKMKKNVALLALTTLVLVGFAGCEPKSELKMDMAKSFETIKAEAAQMNVEQLREKAMLFKNAITARATEVTNVMESMNAQKSAKAGEDIKLNDNADLDTFMQTIGNLKKRYDIYMANLKQKNGDLTGLSLKD